MWVDFKNWLELYRIGDLASVLGVAISIVGFVVTVISVARSKKAAERAEAAANSARESIRRFDAVVDFSAAIAVLDEIRRAHRQQQWSLLPDRYAAIRKLLISIKTANSDLSSNQKTVIQRALLNLDEIERAVEKGLIKSIHLKPIRFNAMISRDIDGLVTVLEKLKAAKVGV